ncbi:glycoside hydrolase family 3 C-terminal domain-containing protein [Sinomicrobium weinanense]|uniref:Glycoside hydrolase family 3 C-terminal domain-containing protein n=1 Tax=Sinomicrobium weinanense TaxID=2842200 RepID=A0A926Q423_9FLAO|nr:glycoside hydrolase family 3 C-terminal domain-containing protein [Sinomicrobium weinanense]MBC9796616.1 glycoside hydrolase family 3 C-terminal domain-containing protein [Sinomicrobium weinanense]MBU3123860.1 glycoside hydrolase family 3 C-terminal domain-containing protein [Sinomicrobium weinanense]
MKSGILYIMVLWAMPVIAQHKIPVYLDVTKPIEERVESALSLMTTEEKVALCHAQSKFSSKGVARLGIPEVWSTDGPHGIREEVLWDEWSGAQWTNDSCTAFPALTCLAATFNTDLSRLYGVSIGEEARYRNKTILLGPGVNIYRTPLNGRNFEYMGEDPYLASRMVVPYIQGVQSAGVAACVKHFALNNQEVWRGHINVHVSDRALHEIYLPAFKAAVQEGNVWSVMGAYNQFRGEHCCHNDLLLNKILKQDWGFDGLVISDWGGVHNTDQAVNNGLDIEMGTYTNGLTTSGHFPYSSYYLANPFLKGIEEGKYDTDVLDDKARRILRVIFRTTMRADRPFGKFVSPEHSKAARKIAQEGIVLLKNKGQFFPVPVDKYKKIAVIGENASRSLVIGGGSSSLKAAYEVSPLQGLKDKYGEERIVHSLGYASGPSLYGREEPSGLDTDSLRTAAVEVAKSADIVLFIGGLNKNHYQDCEGGDRRSMDLPFEQDKLIRDVLKVNKNTAVILLSGNAVSMPWANKVPAIMQGWYLGSEAGNALTDIVSGDVNPSGKLPFSFPEKLEDNGAHFYGELSYPGDSTDQFYKEDILVGYRWFDTKKIKPLFPFGYGLSYTSFAYDNLATDKTQYSDKETVKVSFTLTNSGRSDGAEVPQLYAGKSKSEVPRAAKELKAFKKVYLKAGERKEVELEVPIGSLAYYDGNRSNWVVEPGTYTLMLGSSSGDIKAEVNLKIE